jgi:D-lactate dehydrogenase (cytochrome)
MAHVPGVQDPLAAKHPWYVLLEMSSSQAESGLRAAFEAFLASSLEQGLVEDGTIAASAAQARDLWRIREGMVEAQKHIGAGIKHDVSVPVSSVADFIGSATDAVMRHCPGARPIPFGHVGDGNIHFNIAQPTGGDRAGFLAEQEPINHLVHDIAARLNGSISAEHGIGVLKRDELPRYKPKVALDLMRRIKAALDPDGIMNPGKVI